MKSVSIRYAPLLVTLVIGFAAGWLIRGTDGTGANESRPNAGQSRRDSRPSPAATAFTAPAGASAGVWDPSAEWAQLPAETRAATLRDMLALPEGDARMARFIAVVRGMDRGDIAVAARAIKEGDRRGIIYNKEWEALVTHWGRIAGIRFTHSHAAFTPATVRGRIAKLKMIPQTWKRRLMTTACALPERPSMQGSSLPRQLAPD